MPAAVAEYQDFFENMAVPLHIVGSDGTIRHANKAELELLGYSAEDYIGRDLSDFHADRDTVVDILARLAKGETLKSCPASLLAKDGSLRHVEITSSGRFQDGDFVSTRCLTLDVTELKLAHEQREATEQHWRTAINALPGAIYTTDGEGRINYFNAAAAELTGRAPELGTDAWCRTWNLFKLDGSPLPYDESPMAMALKIKSRSVARGRCRKA